MDGGAAAARHRAAAAAAGARVGAEVGARHATGGTAIAAAAALAGTGIIRAVNTTAAAGSRSGDCFAPEVLSSAGWLAPPRPGQGRTHGMHGLVARTPLGAWGLSLFVCSLHCCSRLSCHSVVAVVDSKGSGGCQ